MTTDTVLRCALGVGDRTLSDFRSDGLSEREMERLEEHVAECAACQARLDAFEAMAQALRAQPEPDDHARLWRNVRASIAAETVSASASPRQRRHAHTGAHAHSTRFWATFGSVAAMVALSAGFVALFASRGGWPAFGTRGQATATPIVIHTSSLTWRQVVVPKGFPGVNQYSEDQTSSYDGPHITQNDGDTAYACQADKKYVTSPVVWATRDAGASWSVITPPNLPANSDGCRLTLDANAANTLIVSFYDMLGPAQPPLPDAWATYASFDGGATWTKPAGLNDGSVVSELASAGKRVYATRTTYTPDREAHTAFAVSNDQMNSWTPIDENLPETRPNTPDIHDTGKVFQVWVNPATSEALELTYAGSLWSTRDDGAHWSVIAFPNGVYTSSPHGPILIVGLPTTRNYLTICGAFTPIDDADAINLHLECTTDNGRTWVDRAELDDYPINVPTLDVTAIGHDGTVFAAGFTGNDSTNPLVFYQLPPGAKYWHSLGTIPGSEHGAGYQVAPAGDHTVIWVFPGITTTSDSTGEKTFTQPYYYVATYP
ncbi:MAG TPA: zf-HC2 domain-containing protein [Ktedonobacterales bacterium]|nr:zf-HC2 domain-containing protein [Ktedonobacterales bacterium]